MYTSEGTVLVQSLSEYLSQLNLGQDQNWVMSGQNLGQLLEKPCELSSRHSFYPVFIKLCQNVCYHLVLTRFENWVMSGQKLGH